MTCTISWQKQATCGKCGFKLNPIMGTLSAAHVTEDGAYCALCCPFPHVRVTANREGAEPQAAVLEAILNTPGVRREIEERVVREIIEELQSLEQPALGFMKVEEDW